jgi:hypothetical protein
MARCLSALACAVSVAAIAPAVARAQLTVSSFSLTPSTTRAGANPDVTVTASFSSDDGDSPRDATISLPPGLLANPLAPSTCDASDFANDSCPDSSKIGDGTITGTSFGQTLSIPTSIYLIAPQGSELARIGLIVDFFDSPVASLTAPVRLRSSPDVGLDIPLTNIPDSIEGVNVQINALTFTLFGTVGGHQFTRNPTSCGAADTRVEVSSYNAPTSPVDADSSFTPIACDALPYAPKLTASASQGTGSALSATITQKAGEAATRTVEMTLPSAFSPNLSALSAPCASADPSSCPSVGSATVTTPLLAAPLEGKLVLASAGLEAVFPPPLSLTLLGTPSFTGGRIGATFSDIPDVPLTSLRVSFALGPGSLLSASSDLCKSAQTLVADLTAHSGASTHLTPMLTVSGCPRRATAKLDLARMRGRHPRVALTVNDPVGLRSLTVRLPGGLRLEPHALPRGIAITVDGHAVRHLAVTTHTVSVTSSGHLLRVVLSAPALRVGAALRNHRVHRLTFALNITDAGGQRKVLLTKLL